MPRPIVHPEINQPSRPAPLIVGRDPGSDETKQGKPFVGRSGQLLFGGFDVLAGEHIQGVVASAGLMREDVNITNRVLRQPWNNDFYRHDWADIEDGLRQLRQLIDQLQPSIIIALGAQAAYDLVPGWATLTDRQPGENSGGRSIKSAKAILDRRGFMWYPEDGTGLPCPVITSLHPAACLYQPMPNRILLDMDFQRVGAVLRGELPRQSWPSYKRITSKADVAPLWEADLVSYDIEITWGGERFLCIAFYTSNGDALLAYEDGLGACVDWLRSDRPKLAHNSQFDRYFLEAKLDIPVGGRHEDTIVGHWACYPELAGKEDTGRETQKKKKNQVTRKGLNFLASVHLNYPWWKTYTSDPGRMGRLCVNDVVATLDCWGHVEADIEDFGVRPQYERQLAKLPGLIAIQKRGMLIDEPLRQERMAAISARQSALQDASTQAALDFLKSEGITHQSDGSEYWWYHDAQCTCCNGGSIKAAHCDSCAGIEGRGSGGSLLKKDLVLWAWRTTDIPKADLDSMKKDELLDLLPPCEVCGGTGKIPTWDFNPMSDTQLPALLWDHLGVPKYCAPGGPNAQEETIKKVLDWSEE